MSTAEMNTDVMDSVRKAGSAIGEAVSIFMLHPSIAKRAMEAGYPDPFAAYFVGRGGVLGETTADTVNSVFVVFEPSLVRTCWEKGIGVQGALAAAAWYWNEAAEFGRQHLAGVEGLERLSALAEQVNAASPDTNLPLFAGWRAMPLADDAAARALQVMFVLRELRAGIHFNALTLAGISAVEAHLLSKGAATAAFMGWQPPYPDCEDKRDRYMEAEQATNRRMTELFESALSTGEAEELAGLSAAARAGIKSSAFAK